MICSGIYPLAMNWYYEKWKDLMGWSWVSKWGKVGFRQLEKALLLRHPLTSYQEPIFSTDIVTNPTGPRPTTCLYFHKQWNIVTSGLKIESNLIHNPFGPLITWIHIHLLLIVAILASKMSSWGKSYAIRKLLLFSKWSKHKYNATLQYDSLFFLPSN
jgi:hypothetical protein